MVQARATIEMDPNFAHAHRLLARIHAEKKMFFEAIEEGQRAVARTANDSWMLSDLAVTYALAGQKAEMEDCLRRANVARRGSPDNISTDAEIYVALEKVDRAFRVLENAYRRRSPVKTMTAVKS